MPGWWGIVISQHKIERNTQSFTYQNSWPCDFFVLNSFIRGTKFFVLLSLYMRAWVTQWWEHSPPTNEAPGFKSRRRRHIWVDFLKVLENFFLFVFFPWLVIPSSLRDLVEARFSRKELIRCQLVASLICGLSLLLALSFPPRGFSPGYSGFPLSSKTSTFKFQFDYVSTSS